MKTKKKKHSTLNKSTIDPENHINKRKISEAYKKGIFLKEVDQGEMYPTKVDQEEVVQEEVDRGEVDPETT